VFASYGETGDPRTFDRSYLRAAAALLELGPEAFAQALGAVGTADTSGDGAAAVAAPMSAVSPGLGRTLEQVLRHPLNAGAHVALADTLLARGVTLRAGLELRIAARLDPSRVEDRYRLARVMAAAGGGREALDELRRLRGDPRAAGMSDRVRRAIVAVEAGGTPPP
jgi:hypothetical protein